MTPETSELPAVAHRTGRPVEVGFPAAVMVEEAANVMAGRPQIYARRMTFLATERRLDLVMAHQAIRHAREGRF